MQGLCKDAECVNTRGSFRCTCKPGTMLDPSRSHCICKCSREPLGLGKGPEQDTTTEFKLQCALSLLQGHLSACCTCVQDETPCLTPLHPSLFSMNISRPLQLFAV